MQTDWDNDLTKLRDTLARLCEREDVSRSWVRDALLDNIGLIGFTSAAVPNWQSILEEALKEEKIVNVINVALRNYPNDRELLDALEKEKKRAERYATSIPSRGSAAPTKEPPSNGTDMHIKQVMATPNMSSTSTETGPLVGQLAMA